MVQGSIPCLSTFFWLFLSCSRMQYGLGGDMPSFLGMRRNFAFTSQTAGAPACAVM